MCITRHHEESEKAVRYLQYIRVYIVSKVYIELIFLKVARCEQALTKEDIQKANRCLKNWSSSLVIIESQIKTIKCHYVPVKMAEMENTENTKC